MTAQGIIRSKDWNWKVWVFSGGLLALFFTLLLGRGGWPGILFAVLLAGLGEYFYGFSRRVPLFYALAGLSPLLLLQYSTIGDFRIRLATFLLLSFFASVATTSSLRSLSLEGISRSAGRIFCTALVIFSTFAMVMENREVHLSGDEPHYLMIAQSLLLDGDFDLTNNIQGKTYHRFLPVDIRSHHKNIGNRKVSYHLPGMAFLMFPFLALFHLLPKLLPSPLFFRLSAALIHAFFALTLFYFLRHLFPGKRITGYWLFFVCSFPLAFHALHLYPELPAATLLMGGYLLGVVRKRWAAAGLLLALIPWFHVKYAPALAVLGGWMAIQRIRSGDIRSLWRLMSFPLVSLLLLAFYSHSLYGSVNPATVFPGADYLEIPATTRLRALTAYFFDQRDGLLFYAPIFFLSFFGFFRPFPHRGLLLGTAGAYVGFHAFSTVRGAYSPAGRPLIFVLPILIALVINARIQIKERGGGRLSRLLFGATLFMSLWILYYPFFMYQPVFGHTTTGTSAIWQFFSSPGIPLPRLLPSFLNRPPGTPVPPANHVWPALLILCLVWYSLRGRRDGTTGFPTLITTLSLAVIPLFCIRPHLNLDPSRYHRQGQLGFYNPSRNFTPLSDPGLYRLKSNSRYRIYLRRCAGSHLDLTRTQARDGRLVVENKTRILFDSRETATSTVSLELADLKSIQVKDQRIIPLVIRATSDSVPFFYLRIRCTRPPDQNHP